MSLSGMDYLRYFFPGTLLLIVLFTAIFSTISIIEDRREGFLQGVLVSPAPRSSIVVGKVSGGALLAWGQALIFAVAAPLLGFPLSPAGALYVILLLALVSYALTGLGFLIAWRMDSTQGFHAVMNLFLMPLWFLSGALFPPDGAPGWLRMVMAVNPLTYALTGLQNAFFGAPSSAASYAGPVFSLAITAAFAAVMHAACLMAVRARPRA
jgi:ABC-2 type transport system permease protein